METLVDANPSTPACYTSLCLEVVGTVSHHNFNMQAHGNWSSALPHEFAVHAGTFLLEGHGSQIIALTWDAVLSNLRDLQEQNLGGTISPEGHIIFTHRLFRVST